MIGVFSVAMFVLAETLAKPLSYAFVGYDGELTDLTAVSYTHLDVYKRQIGGRALNGLGAFTGYRTLSNCEYRILIVGSQTA